MNRSHRLKNLVLIIFHMTLCAGMAISVRAAAQTPAVALNDPLFPDQWNLYDPGAAGQTTTPDISVMNAWDMTTGTSETTIAILDSGIDLAHPDLVSKIWTNQDEIPDNGIDDDNNGKVDDVHGWDFVDNDRYPQDEDGWGTFMAGIAGAATNNGTGIAGIAWNALIMPVRVLSRDDVGQATTSLDVIVDGIRYALQNHARIIQFGFYIEEQLLSAEQRAALESIVNEAHDAGVLLVAPVGDRGLAGNPPVYPAAFPTVIGVTATDRNRERLAAAGQGTFVEIAAPGINLLGLLPDGRYEQGGTGTEFAVSHVAGVGALVWAMNPSLSPDQIRTFIRETADDLGPVGYDESYGFGLLNAAAALQATPHLLEIRPHELHFEIDAFGVIIPPTHEIINPNTSGLTWQARTNVRWLTIEGLTDTTPSSLTVSVNPAVIPNCGHYAGVITVEGNQPNVADGTQTVQVTLDFATTTCETARLPLIRR